MDDATEQEFVFPPESRPDWHLRELEDPRSKHTFAEKMWAVSQYVSYGIDALVKIADRHGGQMPDKDTVLTDEEHELFPRHIRDRIEENSRSLRELDEEVNSNEAKNILKTVEAKFDRTSPDACPKNLEELRKSNKRKIIFDFDGTISDTGKYRGEAKTDLLLPASDPLDFYIASDRSKFPYAAAYWQQVMAEFPDIFEEGGRQVPLRNGMAEALERLLADSNTEIAIISTNFQPFLEAALKRIKGGSKIQIFCVKDGDIRCCAKGDLIKKIALENPDFILEYAGDGGSDMPALEARGLIAAFHAVRGLSFDKRMISQSIEHFAFTDGDELLGNLGIGEF